MFEARIGPARHGREVREVLFRNFKTGPLERGINAPLQSIDGWIYAGRGHGGSEISGPHLSDNVFLPLTGVAAKHTQGRDAAVDAVANRGQAVRVGPGKMLMPALR